MIGHYMNENCEHCDAALEVGSLTEHCVRCGEPTCGACVDESGHYHEECANEAREFELMKEGQR